ncbi:hypothetical protein RIF29_11014 [Crotalaria pallida]|uniref:Trehalase n=1 Tax=Crotalaria pallida TaxID=3830 RepID=A0AAN9G0H0_CROPI
MWNKSRPESSIMDKESASKFLNVSEKQQFNYDLVSTAESGWDFSTRWMRDPPDFTTLATTYVIPVDLNAFLLGMELNIAFFAKVTRGNSKAEQFLEISDVRKKEMNSIFWNANTKLDYWLSNSTSDFFQVLIVSLVLIGDSSLGSTTPEAKCICVFASNFVPLWIKLFASDTSLVGSVVESLKTSGLIRAAGIATSLTDSGQQWDFPNGWAPLQHMLVEGLVKTGLKEARSLAEEISIKWITTNYIVYKKTGVMHEKFDVEHCGEFGGGGEYVPQVDVCRYSRITLVMEWIGMHALMIYILAACNILPIILQGFYKKWKRGEKRAKGPVLGGATTPEEGGSSRNGA